MKSYLTQMASMTALALAADAGGEAVSTAFKNVTISGETFQIKVPYEEGHTLNAAEASVLNQTYLENIRNNAAGKIKAAKEKAAKDGTTFSLDTPIGGDGEDKEQTLRQVIQNYAETYEFGVRVGRTSEPADPLERECRAIAREAINAKLKANGVKRKDVSDEAFEEALAKHSKNPAIVKEAERRLKVRASLGLEELDLNDLGGEADEGETETEGAEG